MKKKITAVLLTLCLVLGLLPLSAMAATWKVKVDGKDVTVTKTGNSVTVTDNETDLNKYYTFTRVEVSDKNDTDITLYYTMKIASKGYKVGDPGDFTVTISEQTYTITFDPNGGTGTSKTVSTGTDGKVKTTDVPEFTFSDHKFLGWSTDKNAETPDTIDWLKAFKDDTTLYAVWEEVEPEVTYYTIKLDANGGTWEEGAVTEVQTQPDGTLSSTPAAPTAPKDKFFAGWNTQKDGSGENVVGGVTEFKSDGTIYAQWSDEDKTVEITLNANGGKLAGESKVKTNAAGVLDAKIADPTRDDYVFLGWFTAAKDGTAVDFSVPFEKATTIYAHWAAKVTFDFNDGSGKKTVVTAVDGKVTAPADPTRGDGYKFLGWYDKKTGGEKFNAETSYNTPTTFYAQWSIRIYFYPNEGTLNGSGEGFFVETGADGTLGSKMPGTPTRTGYKFVGWFIEDIEDEDGFGDRVDGMYPFTEPTEVVAKWSKVADLTQQAVIEAETETTIDEPENVDAYIEANIEEGTDTVILGAKAPAGTTDSTKAKIHEKVTVSGSFIKAILDKVLSVDTIEIAAVTGSVSLPRSIAESITGNVVYEEQSTGTKQSSVVEGQLPATGKKGSPAKGAKLHTIEISLKDQNGDILTRGGKEAEVSAFMDMGSVSYKNLAMFYLGGSTPEKKDVTNYENSMISWMTDHLSPWGAIELMANDEDDSTVPNETKGPGGGGGGGSSSSGYTISVSKTTNGKVSVSPSKAEEGDTVTITVTPDKGYELDKLTVKDADGNTIRTTKTSDGKYTFTMPDGKVTIEATFKAIEEEDTAPAPATPSFSDVPSSFWAYQQIRWVAEQGIMNGYANGTFAPDNNTTRQALWMVLGRLSGELNADSTMAQAREWAVANNVSDGTNPGNAMSRQQMVTMLYRYAQMKGYATNGSTDLSTYPDAAGVASYAQDALSWAVANGVVTGTTDGRLNPEGTASRAHFAVFMYRFCGLYADEA